MVHRISAPRLLASLLLAGTAVTACNGQTVTLLDAEPKAPNGLTDGTGASPQQTSGRVDLLFAVDDSSSMKPKQVLLARAAGRLVERLLKPLCRDANGVATSQSSFDPRGEAVCPSGSSLEFAQVRDLHVGVLTSSLGNAGNTGADVACEAANGHRATDRATLTGRGIAGAPIERGNFLAYGSLDAVAGYTDIGALKDSLTALVLGAGDQGCGIESQLESVYQFLAAPDPWQEIAVEENKARYDGLNTSLLAQRRDFLRADSLVAVVMITDEDDASLDPLSVGGTGRYFASSNFPGGIDRGGYGTTAAKGTPICETDPNSPDCTSCAFGGCGDQAASYYAAGDDDLNVRFFDMKRRFGVDPLYPVERYVRGFSQTGVPARDAEHIVPTGVELSSLPTPAYDTSAAGCRNPLFAGSLPSDHGDELCDLPAGPRNASLVYFTVLGGVPNDLVSADKLDADGRLRDDSWNAILGRDYARYDRGGLDARLVQSITPRAGRPGPGAVDAEPNDPDNRTHRDWDTHKMDLQYACSYQLPPNLIVPAFESMDCRNDSDAPLCAPGPRDTRRAQIRGRAYPTPRPFAVAKALGRQSTIASLCPRDTSDPASASYGYAPALDALVDRMSAGLAK